MALIQALWPYPTPYPHAAGCAGPAAADVVHEGGCTQGGQEGSNTGVYLDQYIGVLGQYLGVHEPVQWSQNQ